ncbi:hypothetical protein [Planktosalinus lacus]|nr:hypothetical protein [Planktosalinus lacus]
MFLFQSSYSNFLVLALAMLLAVPCTVKQNTKQLLNIESAATSNSAKSKSVCTTYQELKEHSQKIQAEKKLRPLATTTQTVSRMDPGQPLLLPDFYNDYKEKIPSHLVFGQFLI